MEIARRQREGIENENLEEEPFIRKSKGLLLVILRLPLRSTLA